jgi:eukaryotic-like serine/threonine-protein kinase
MSDQEPTVYNGRYELHRQIARGGMADVFLARDLLLDRPVAVKVLFPQFAADPSFVERFRREAQAAANLNQPNITSVFDWGEEGGTYFIVMEFVDGRSLAEILRSEGMLHPDRAADITTDVAAALSFAHRNGVVHRDIKPGNILIAPSGQVKVTDFGIARAFGGAGDTNLTQAGSVMGTATYFSPEQAQGKMVDPRSDLYSLGVVLYEMLASRPPFTGETPLVIAYNHVQVAPDPPSSINPRIPQSIEAITMRLLAKDPNDRYPSAEDLRADLRRFREGQPVLAAGAAGVAAAATMATPAAAANATTALPVTPALASTTHEYYDDDDEYDDSPNRTGWFIAGLVALVAVLVGLLAIFANALGIGGSDDVVRIEVPGVLLMTEAEATEILEAAGFEVAVEYEANVDLEPGIVFRQNPLDGAMEPEGSTVTIFVSQGDVQFPMDTVVGGFESEVIPFLEGKGLILGNVEYVFDDDSVDGEVLQQFPPPGQPVAAGTAFDLVVSRGPEQVEIPDVRRLPVDEAEEILIEKGLQVIFAEEHSDTIAEESVIRTDPTHRTMVDRNSFVTVVVSLGPEPAQEAPVPNVVNLTQATAEQRLTSAGFVPQVTFSSSTTVPSGSVITQDPAGGTIMFTGETVSIVVSTGPPGTTTTEPGATTTSTSPGPTFVPGP